MMEKLSQWFDEEFLLIMLTFRAVLLLSFVVMAYYYWWDSCLWGSAKESEGEELNLSVLFSWSWNIRLLL